MAFEPIIHLMRGIQNRLNGSSLRLNGNVQDPKQIAFLRQLQKEMRQEFVLDIPLNELNVVVFDIETTGFYPNKGDEIISIGAVKVIDGKIAEDQAFYSLIQSNGEISKEIQLLTGITNEQIKDAPPLSEVLIRFFQYVQDLPLVAHHANHEKNFLQHASWLLYKLPLKHRLIDTSFLYRIADPQLNIVKLEDFCEYHQIPIENRHHALSDAKLTAKLWCIYIPKVQGLGCHTLRELYEQLALIK
ncbi:exonuclease domain-containing protein [Caldibacillus lycopersici]|uniref:Exonuclease domain-containing protein n=1 Tax=Perspicuibacillus lycopersici TaxID=1325689 RepID=A0AAE3ITZ4_9BACI|nr:exonuclease domain-containing protein [Perspicuibacillus lycopersici]MCU9614446.1 exonuclease domain-containing protein [Perspicuibacillus lycopersici]